MAEPMPKTIAVLGAFDDVRSSHLRLLEEAARLGQVTVLLYSDEAVRAARAGAPKFPLAERLYFLQAVRFVTGVIPLNLTTQSDSLPALDGFNPSVWVDDEIHANDRRSKFCRDRGLAYQVLSKAQLDGFPEQPPPPVVPGLKKVIVTGCYDWLHSGHVRFFEEVSGYGDLYV